MERLAAMMKAVLHLKVVRMHNEKVFQEELRVKLGWTSGRQKKKLELRKRHSLVGY
jgi:hypothetical protein